MADNKDSGVCCNEDPKAAKKTQGKQQQQKQQNKNAGQGGGGGGGGGKKKGAVTVEELTPPPEYMSHRVQVFEALKKEAESQERPQAPIKITLPDGKVLDGVSFKTTPYEVAAGISKGLANSCIAAKVDDVMWDMHRPLEADCSLTLCKFDSPEGKKVFWHSSAHLLGQAIERRWGANLCIGPALAEGFYYDLFKDDLKVSEDDYDQINALVSKIVSEKQPFERLLVPKEKALEMFKHNPFKVEIISSKVPDGECCSVYRCGPLIDLCRGPHVPNTGYVKAFKVTKNSSAYWLGSADRESLQRVYGIAFPDNKQLAEWEHFQAEAEKRDHRNVGKKQELFMFHPLSPGSAFMLPHGTRIYNKLMDFLRGEYRQRGFQEVVSPNIYNADLWKQSGHWQNYHENMFSFKCEEQDFALKPMNCPGHCLIFGHRSRSYRELPLRIADFGVLHRNELSGALTGLTRVRRFQQDDAHIFCRQDQIQQEIAGALEFMESVYGKFGFQFDLELSTRPEKFLGEVEVWNDAEKQLEEVLNQSGKKWKLNPGDGAFYGPKIDIHIMDALKRSHQCATIQLDFQLPIRFKLEFMAESGIERPVIVHRAILGSVERFMAILIEHTAGDWPFWISPRQVTVLPISQKFNDYASKVGKVLNDEGYHVDIDLSDEIFGKKVAEARNQKYNYMLIVGKEEEDTQTVNVRQRGQEKPRGAMSLQELLAEFKQNVDTYARDK